MPLNLQEVKTAIGLIMRAAGTRNIASFIALAFFAACFIAPSDSFGFSIPERLTFDLTWTGVKAGTATMEIFNSEDVTRIVSTAKSADWVSVFYTVDDRIDVVLPRTEASKPVGAPNSYRIKVREGKHRRDKELTFDRINHKAFYVDHLKGEKKEFEIRNDVFDPLSSFYYVRTLQLDAGKSVFVDVLDSKKLWNVEVQVIRRERITTQLGSFDTIVIKPLMKSEGIFNKKGDMYIWLTDDTRRIPVKMQSKVAVGKITATLVSID